MRSEFYLVRDARLSGIRSTENETDGGSAAKRNRKLSSGAGAAAVHRPYSVPRRNGRV